MTPARRVAAVTFAGALGAAVVVAGCAADAPPRGPAALERRAVVVPDVRDANAVDAASCASACPPPREGEALAGCHPSNPDRGRSTRRAVPGGPSDGWLVCYFHPR